MIYSEADQRRTLEEDNIALRTKVFEMKTLERLAEALVEIQQQVDSLPTQDTLRSQIAEAEIELASLEEKKREMLQSQQQEQNRK